MLDNNVVSIVDIVSDRRSEIDEANEEIAKSLSMGIVEELYSEFGIDVMKNPETIKELLCINEAIHSIIERVEGREDPCFSDITDAMFGEVITEDNAEYMLNYFLEG